MRSMYLALIYFSDHAQKWNYAYNHVCMAHVQMIHTSVNAMVFILAKNVTGYNVQCVVLLWLVTAPSQKDQSVFQAGTMTVAW